MSTLLFTKVQMNLFYFIVWRGIWYFWIGDNNWSKIKFATLGLTFWIQTYRTEHKSILMYHKNSPNKKKKNRMKFLLQKYIYFKHERKKEKAIFFYRTNKVHQKFWDNLKSLYLFFFPFLFKRKTHLKSLYHIYYKPT